jgi:mannose-6-phosphate isomerase
MARLVNMNPYPLLLDPAYKDYIWGGSRIPALFNRPLPPGVYAESWELSDRAEGASRIANGPLAGRPLADAVARWGRLLLGTRPADGTRFPLLVKLIDAKERLSIQVHPDDATAARGLGEAKTEAWHVLAAGPGAQVFAGFKPGVDAARFDQALKQRKLETCLQAIPVTVGDTIFIPGGRVHAICEGLLLLEVQQNSNTTYRVYDWGRVGKDGKPRELHLEQALKVIRWQDDAPVTTVPRLVWAGGGTTVTELVTSSYFRLERLELAAPFATAHDGASFHALFANDGPVELTPAGGEPLAIPHGCTCLVPAALNRYTLGAVKTPIQVLRISA